MIQNFRVIKMNTNRLCSNKIIWLEGWLAMGMKLISKLFLFCVLFVAGVSVSNAAVPKNDKSIKLPPCNFSIIHHVPYFLMCTNKFTPSGIFFEVALAKYTGNRLKQVTKIKSFPINNPIRTPKAISMVSTKEGIYLAFFDGNFSGLVKVFSVDGDNWKEIGSFSSIMYPAIPLIRVDNLGRLYVMSIAQSGIKVFRRNKEKWQQVGSAFGGRQSGATFNLNPPRVQFGLDGITPFVMEIDRKRSGQGFWAHSYNDIHLYRYINDKYFGLFNHLNWKPLAVKHVGILKVFNNQPYIVGGSPNSIVVYTYKNKKWSLVGPPIPNSFYYGGANSQLLVKHGVVYVLWHSIMGTKRYMRLSRYHDGHWQTIAKILIAANKVPRYFHLAIDNKTAYVLIVPKGETKFSLFTVKLG